jgi:predicted metal-dependent phosphotriesterase family hydrolase
MNIHEERYVVDKDGNRIGVVLEVGEYEKLLADVEELESIRAFDQAKSSAEIPISFDQAVSEIERRQA